MHRFGFAAAPAVVSGGVRPLSAALPPETITVWYELVNRAGRLPGTSICSVTIPDDSTVDAMTKRIRDGTRLLADVDASFLRVSMHGRPLPHDALPKRCRNDPDYPFTVLVDTDAAFLPNHDGAAKDDAVE
ncbi:DNA replication complex GINS protein SLD5 [Plasmodiophora brassicae]